MQKVKGDPRSVILTTLNRSRDKNRSKTFNSVILDLNFPKNASPAHTQRDDTPQNSGRSKIEIDWDRWRNNQRSQTNFPNLLLKSKVTVPSIGKQIRNIKAKSNDD